jgi:DNA-binding helix-hairpin-helix protein with protein kinase domain
MTTPDGRAIRFRGELGRGGEGVVYEIEGRSDIVGKTYLRPITPLQTAKIEAMVRARNADLEAFAAWPLEPLKEGGVIRGFLMPRIPPSFKPIHSLYGPASRAAEFPGATWAFLIHVARNLCQVFASLHGLGHVIGDVNHDNIRVNSKGLIRLIDCDSFQIVENGQRFRCTVGTSTHTPPELQSRPLNTVDRTPVHDAFGLAVVLFQLLFMGRHPFAGRYRGPGEMPLEQAIAEYRFAYGPAAATRQMEPPPNTVGLDLVTPTLANMFRRAFEKGPTELRPRPDEWLRAVEELQGGLNQCGHKSTHIYLSTMRRCPWCEIDERAKTNVFPFPPPVTSEVTSFSIETVIGRLTTVSTPLAIPPVPQPSAYPAAQPREIAAAISTWNEARRLAAERSTAAALVHAAALTRFLTHKAVGEKLLMAVKYACGAGAISFCCPPFAFVGRLLMENPNAGLLLAALVGGAFVVGMYLDNKRPPVPISVAQVPTPLVLEQTRAALIHAESVYAELLRRYATLKGAADLSAAIKRASEKVNQHKELHAERLRRLAVIEKAARARQLDTFLTKHRIESASIDNIGPGRKATLRSYGIETAADISAQAVGIIHGFGPALTGELLWWRSQVESQFHFDPGQAVSTTDMAKLDAELAKIRAVLERDIVKSLGEAERIRKSNDDQISPLMDEMVCAAVALAKARAAAQGIQ